jgi:hypothetical protein
MGAATASLAATTLIAASRSAARVSLSRNPLAPGYPVTVLGYAAARTLGIADVSGSPRVYLGGR